MKKKLFKRILLFILVLALLGVGGVFGGRIAYSVYNKIMQKVWTTEKLMIDVQQRVGLLEKRTSLLAHQYTFDYSWMDGAAPVIAHAGGGLDGREYTNSYEAFVANYEAGHRIFEFDFDLTTDEELIVCHDKKKWRAIAGADQLEYTKENFLAMPLYGEYQPMTYEDVIDLLAEYPDAYLITDTKFFDRSTVLFQFSQIVRYAKKHHPEVLDRIIPQIYSEEMLDWVMAVHPFNSIIFTLYKAEWTPESVIKFCNSSGVRFITMPRYSFTPEIANLWGLLSINIGVHTINSQEDAAYCFENGVDMVYTDFLTTEMFPKM